MKKDKHSLLSKGKMSSALLEGNLEKRFQTATNTQDSIQTLSLWLLHHKGHHQKIVSSWMKVLQKAKISHRLTLFYLANDVVQNSKRKNFVQFLNSFAEVLREATLLVRNDTIRPSIQRCFNIWEQRSVYSPEFIADLRAILANNKVPATAPSKLLAEFKPDTVIEKLRSVSKLDIDVNNKLGHVNLSKLKATDAEIVQQFKDRIHGQQFKREFDDGASRLEELIKLMDKEMTERTELILLLEQSEIYYDTQKGEAKIVANAYKNFGARIDKLQKKLEELSASLPSPLPSPSEDAPSPTTSDQELELNLPSDNTQEKELESVENAPSPEGSPEDLNLPDMEEEKEDKQEKPITVPVGNPIPTLSNFFPHEEKGMTSWLGTFAQKKIPVKVSNNKTEIKKGEEGSLESRLSNLIQNMPSLPAGIQNTIFGNNSSPKTSFPNSVETSGSKKDKVVESNAPTPNSGQNTPLQDEDTHSSHAFFSKLASSNKTHSPKDILKGLTNLIQSASAEKDDSQKREKFSSFSSDVFEHQTGMSTFIKNIIPSISVSSQNSSSSMFFNSTQTNIPPENTLPVIITPASNSFESMPAYSSSSVQNEGRSFIPSLVPSTPQENFGFGQQPFPTDEYNPEMELFDTDMDVEIDNDVDDDSMSDVPSPVHEPLSPVTASPPLETRPMPVRRLSTLITLVADEPQVSESLPNDQYSPVDNVYKNDKENNFSSVNTWVDPMNCQMEPRVPITDVSVNYKNDKENFSGVNTWVDSMNCQMEPRVPITDVAVDYKNDKENNFSTVNTWVNPPNSQMEHHIPITDVSVSYKNDKENNFPRVNTWVDSMNCQIEPHVSVSEVAVSYKSDKENNFVTVNTWVNPLNSQMEPRIPIPDVAVNSPNEEYFIGKSTEPPPNPFYSSAPPPPIPPVMSQPNGQNNIFISPAPPIDDSHSRIETVQSHRNNMNDSWFEERFDDNQFDNSRNRFPGPPSNLPPDGHYFNNNRNFSPRQYQPRQNWHNRNRPEGQFHQKRDHPFTPRPFRHPQNNRFSHRGRGGYNNPHRGRGGYQ